MNALAGLAVVLVITGVAPRPVPASAAQAGGTSPFGSRAVAGAEFAARSIQQDGCPLEVAVTGTGRDERGVTLSLRLTNAADAPVSRHVIGVWVIAADGTVRGSQQAKGSVALAAGESRSTDIVLRMIAVQKGDTIVAAVQEAAGATVWRKDQKTLQDEVRTAVVSPK